MARGAALAVCLVLLSAGCALEGEQVSDNNIAIGAPEEGCAFDENYCSGDCVLILTDAAHCGGCNVACPAGSSCSNGGCVSDSRSSPPGTPAPESPGFVRPLRCAAWQSLCGGRCLDTVNDLGNCGGCGRACIAGALCVDGRCLTALPAIVPAHTGRRAP